MKLLIVFIGLLVLCFSVKAIDYNCPDITSSNVQYYLSHVLDHSGNDRLLLPAGTVHWTNGVYGTNQSIIGSCAVNSGTNTFGAGVSSTFIVNDLTNTSLIVFPGNIGLITMTFTNAAHNSEISGIEFVRGNSTYAHYLINLFGNCSSWCRFDNCTFSNMATTAISTFFIQDIEGVADHNTIIGVEQIAQHYMPSFGGPIANAQGNLSWASPPYWGSSSNWFWENNVIPGISLNGFDTFDGGRWVYRHNMTTNSQFTTHGAEGQGGGKQFECYNNVFAWTAGTAQIGQYRSGSGVWFSNTFVNFPNTPSQNLQIYRMFNIENLWGGANGMNPWDSNDPVIYASGNHTGTNNSYTLVDTNQNWTSNQWVGYECNNLDYTNTLINAIVNHVTTNGWAEITANNSNSLTLVVAWIAGYGAVTNILFKFNDRYTIRKVINAFESPGGGQGALLWSISNQNAPTNTAFWPTQAVETVWSWAETENGTNFSLLTSADPVTVVAGVQYTNSATAKPGYTPYQYPHPLDQPAFFTNLSISYSPIPLMVGQTPTISGAIQTNGITDSSVVTGNAQIVTNSVNCLSPAISSGTYSASPSVPLAAVSFPMYAYIKGSSSTAYNNLTSSVINLTINLWPTTNNLVSTLNPATSGSFITFIDACYTNGMSPSDMNSGTIRIYTNGVLFASGTPTAGAFTLTTSVLPVGTYIMTASYSGNSKYTTNFFAQFTQVVNAGGPKNTTTTIISTPNPSSLPNSVTFTSDILTNILAGNAGGTVAYIVNGVTITNVPVVNGIASWSTASLPTVNSTIQAIYTGDANYNGSTSTNYLQYNFNGSFLAAVSAPIQPTNVYWIGTNATGCFISNGDNGFPNNALDGSTTNNFDANMNALPAGSIMNLLPETFHTMGSLGWKYKSNQKIIGSGFGTVIQFPSDQVGVSLTNVLMVDKRDNGVSGLTLANLSLDGNYQAGQTNTRLLGVSLLGDNNLVSNVMVMNFASFNKLVYTEGFGVSINGNFITTSATNNIFDGIIVTNYSCDASPTDINDLVALNMVGVQGAIVRNCQIWQKGATNWVFAINPTGSGISVSNNYANGVMRFSYADTFSGATNLLFSSNTVSNIVQFFQINSGFYTGLHVVKNTGNIIRSQPSDNGTVFITSGSSTFNDLLFSANSINSNATTNGIFDIHFGTNINVVANTFFKATPALETNFVNCSGITFIGNSNFLNQPWP